MKKVLLLFALMISASWAFASTSATATVPSQTAAQIMVAEPERPCMVCEECAGVTVCAGASTCAKAAELLADILNDADCGEEDE